MLPTTPTWTRISRKNLSIETLNRYRIDYGIDTIWTSRTSLQLMKISNMVQDPDFVLIKRGFPERLPLVTHERD